MLKLEVVSDTRWSLRFILGQAGQSAAYAMNEKTHTIIYTCNGTEPTFNPDVWQLMVRELKSQQIMAVEVIGEEWLDSAIYQPLLDALITHYHANPNHSQVTFMTRVVLSSSQYELWTIYQYLEQAIQMQEMAPNIMTPAHFIQWAQQQIGELQDQRLQVMVYDKQALKAERMNLLLSVNAGSDHEPYVGVFSWMNNPKDPNIYGLAGKGITMDTGGYNLKSSAHQTGMKFDMSGAAIGLQFFNLVVALNLPINLVFSAGLTENCIGGHATFTDSIVQAKDGRYVEIGNTDAEGRLVLADVYTLLIEKYNITHLLSLATLTGGVQRALGECCTGVFTNNQDFYDTFPPASVLASERIWQLPIQPENYSNLQSSVADIRSTGNTERYGLGNAAAFLETFSQNLPFVHFDIAGTAAINGHGTGVMLRTLFYWAKNLGGLQ